MLPGASNAEIPRELAILKRTYRLAMQAGKLLHAPHVPMLQENNIRKGFFEREMFEAVKEKLSDPLKSVVTFAYIAGRMLTGHKTRSVFDRYDIVNEDDLCDAVSKLAVSGQKGTIAAKRACAAVWACP